MMRYEYWTLGNVTLKLQGNHYVTSSSHQKQWRGRNHEYLANLGGYFRGLTTNGKYFVMKYD